MNVPYSWLAELLPGLPSVQETVGLLDGIGLAVEEVRELPAAPRGVVVVRVESVRALEGSERLLLATATDGTRILQIVTGAPNVSAGMHAAWAGPGTVLPDIGMTVSSREVMGVRSEGMLCSPRELGLYDFGGGLLVLGEDVRAGDDLHRLWPAETVIELELTPNRADAFSMVGVARDLAAKLGSDFKHPVAELEVGGQGPDNGLRVEVEDRSACPRFTLSLIEDVVPAPSPVWLQRRLAALGLRPRNNIVDVTNYVTFELGQPSHAYDRADLGRDTIVVRRARPGESLVALNEETLEFSEQDLLIATPVAAGGAAVPAQATMPIGVAGVIGGLDHSVKAATRAVALEVAHFDPVTVRGSAKRLGLSTDASYRFERGVDPNLPPMAAARAAALIAELAGGRVHPGFTEVGGDAALRQISFRPSRVAHLMDMQIPAEEQLRYLRALGCVVDVRAEDDWRVTAPSWRFDLAIEEDLIEEVSRLHGYEDIPATVPAMQFVPPATDSTHRGLRTLLAGMGLQETMGYVFASPEELARAEAPAPSVLLANPPSAERSVLRTALYPGLLAAARTNHNEDSLALFEVGHVFAEAEEERLGLLLRGPWISGGWLPDQPLDFYVVKGLLEKLAATLGTCLRLEPRSLPHLHPGAGAAVFWDGREAGWMGRLHPELAARFELPETYLAELVLPLPAAEIGFMDFLRQPFAERDVAVVAPRDVPYADLATLVRHSAGEKLERVEPFDVYQGDPIPEGLRSVALRLQFRDSERALRDEEVDGYMANVITALRRAGYDIRDR